MHRNVLSVLGLSMVMIGIGIVTLLMQANVTSQCLALGYPEGRLDIALTRYCIKRLDQTDVVIPLNTLMTVPQEP